MAANPQSANPTSAKPTPKPRKPTKVPPKPVIQLTPEQVQQVIARIENALPGLVAQAIAMASGQRQGPARPARTVEQTKVKIVQALKAAPEHADKHPDIARYMRQRAMSKTVLRRYVSNSNPLFEVAVNDLINSGQILQSVAPNSKGRAIVVIGLP